MCAEYLAKNPPPTLEAQVASFKAKKAEVAPPDQATAGELVTFEGPEGTFQVPKDLADKAMAIGDQSVGARS